LKLAYVLNTYPQRSHSFIRRELNALERRGHSVLRLAMRGADTPMVDPLDAAEEARTEHVLKAGAATLAKMMVARIIEAPQLSFAAWRLLLEVWRASDKRLLRHLVYYAEACHVAARCRNEGIEHIHAHFGTNAATVAMLAGALTGIPFSFTVHGPEEFDSPAALGLPKKMRRAAFTVAISQFGRSQLYRWVKPDVWQRIKVVHCGIEPQAFAQPVPIPPRPFRFVSIGRFAEQKGHLVLIEAFARLRRDAPDAHLTLVGDGEMRDEIERAIHLYDVGRNVTITGWVGEDRIRKELANAHALVAPSFAEGLPMVVMEAMAAARPVVTTYVAGNPELVLHGMTGWLVPAGDAAALGDALEEVCATPLDGLTKMGNKGRERVLARHDIDGQVEQLAQHFANSIKGTMQT